MSNPQPSTNSDVKTTSERKKDIRIGNLTAARAVSDAVRSSLGPKGMDKMISKSNGNTLITNDGATILSEMNVSHPAAQLLVEISKAQDIEAGDGTTSVCILAGSLLEQAEALLEKGIHPRQVTEAWKIATIEACEWLRTKASPISLADRALLESLAATSLQSKVVANYAHILAPIAVQAVLSVMDTTARTVDLRNIRVVTRVGESVEETAMVDGLVFKQETSKGAGGPTRIEDAKIGLIQFQISPPKTDMENQLIVGNQEEIDRLAQDEKKYILRIVKKILKTGCNVLLIQKSILRDAINILGSHYLAKKGVLVIKDIERDEMAFISESLGCMPVADPSHFTVDKLGSARLVEEVASSGGRIVKITGVENPGKTVSIVVRGANSLLVDEVHRSLHDALCVIRCLVKEPFMVAGGGACEAGLSVRLAEFAETRGGLEAYCIRSFADALEIIPSTLAENAGLNAIGTVTELRRAHAQGNHHAGIDISRGRIGNMVDAEVVQPLLVNVSALTLASEFVGMILKVDDVVPCM